VLYFLGAEEIEPKVSVNLVFCLGSVKASTFTKTFKSKRDAKGSSVQPLRFGNTVMELK
jgi:hypothetical protein